VNEINAVKFAGDHFGQYVRRASGKVVYEVAGTMYVPQHLHEVVRLNRKDGTTTWASASEISKFRRCDIHGNIINEEKTTMSDFIQTGAGLTQDEIVGQLARNHDQATLQAACIKRQEIEAATEADRVSAEANAARTAELRETAVKALEKAAQDGDVGAARELLQLTR
jgi:hypothetical protein